MRHRGALALGAVIVFAACAEELELREADHDFPEMPLTSAVGTGPDGDVYVVGWMADATVQRFDARGRPVEEWGTGAVSQANGRCPRSLAVDAAGYVYVLAVGDPGERSTIEVFDATGTAVGILNDLGEGGLDIAASADGRVYVALAEANGIRVFDRHGERLDDWTPDEMRFSRPVSVAVDTNGRLVVADVRLAEGAPPRVFVMTEDGDVLDQWEVEDLHAEPVLYDVAVDPEGRVFVAANGGLVRAYSADGELLGEFEAERAPGDPTEVPDCPPLLVPPRIAAGSEGLIYWTPSWDRAMHPPASLRVYRIDWGDE